MIFRPIRQLPIWYMADNMGTADDVFGGYYFLVVFSHNVSWLFVLGLKAH